MMPAGYAYIVNPADTDKTQNDRKQAHPSEGEIELTLQWQIPEPRQAFLPDPDHVAFS
jgi:hypothetical protein